MKFTLENFFCVENFLEGQILRKYFNTKFYNIAFVHYYYYMCKEKQARAGVKSGGTYGDSNWHGRVFLKELLYSRLSRTCI